MRFLNSFGLSDIGLSRPNNEDVWTAIPEMGFFAIADGMGGHKAGEVAAQETIDSLSSSIRSIKGKSRMELIIELRSAIEKANLSVYQKGKSSDSLTGMGTTLCCMIWSEEFVVYAHVGDSRIYRLRQNQLKLLTEDHSFFSKWLSFGKRALDCETPYPYKNVITRAVGTCKKAKPEISHSEHEPGDLYFLCTDGLSDVLPIDAMEHILCSAPTLSVAGHRLIEMAKLKGSHDNMTLLLIQRV